MTYATQPIAALTQAMSELNQDTTRIARRIANFSTTMAHTEAGSSSASASKQELGTLMVQLTKNSLRHTTLTHLLSDEISLYSQAMS